MDQYQIMWATVLIISLIVLQGITLGYLLVLRDRILDIYSDMRSVDNDIMDLVEIMRAYDEKHKQG